MKKGNFLVVRCYCSFVGKKKGILLQVWVLVGCASAAACGAQLRGFFAEDLHRDAELAHRLGLARLGVLSAQVEPSAVGRVRPSTHQSQKLRRQQLRLLRLLLWAKKKEGGMW